MYKLGVKIREMTFHNPVISGSITVHNFPMNNYDDFVEFAPNEDNDRNEQNIDIGTNSVRTINLIQQRFRNARRQYKG